MGGWNVSCGIRVNSSLFDEIRKILIETELLIVQTILSQTVQKVTAK